MFITNRSRRAFYSVAIIFEVRCRTLEAQLSGDHFHVTAYVPAGTEDTLKYDRKHFLPSSQSSWECL